MAASRSPHLRSSRSAADEKSVRRSRPPVPACQRYPRRLARGLPFLLLPLLSGAILLQSTSCTGIVRDATVRGVLRWISGSVSSLAGFLPFEDVIRDALLEELGNENDNEDDQNTL